MKLIILVLSYDDDEIYSKFHKSQMETWDSINIGNVSTYYYFGNHECDEICGNKILTSISESVENCGYKLLNSLELIKNLEYDFIFRTNSSSYVDKSILYDKLSKINDLNYYAGINGYFRNVSFASGSGFVMTKNLVNLILENKSNFDHGLIDDVAVGKLVGDLGIPLYSAERFDIHNNKHIAKNHYHYRIKTDNRENDISTMYRIHEIKTK